MTTYALQIGEDASRLAWESETLGVAFLRAYGAVCGHSGPVTVVQVDDVDGEPASFTALAVVSPPPAQTKDPA